MDIALHRWFAPAFDTEEQTLPNIPRFHHVGAGLVALADWIGSDRRFFDFMPPFDIHTTQRPIRRRRKHFPQSELISAS